LEYTTTPTEVRTNNKFKKIKIWNINHDPNSQAEWHIESNKPSISWPENGKISFKNYSTRYRDGLDLILKRISLEVKSNEKIGVVGRTGAGEFYDYII
jgi:ABC-type multidrug transport system fused ATPase/permease subunit